MPFINFCGRKSKKSVDITNIAAKDAKPNDIAIGTERTIIIAKTKPKIIPGSKLFFLNFFIIV